MSEHLLGFFKLQEEMGELNQVMGKLGAFPDGKHPDNNGDLYHRLNDEIGDVYAALDYFIHVNGLHDAHVQERRKDKFEIFNKWVLTGLPYSGPDLKTNGAGE